MFEQSMVVSQVGRASTGERWTWAGSVVVQGCAAALLIALPLLRPQGMSLEGRPSRAFVPWQVTKLREVKVKQLVETRSTAFVAVAPASGLRAMTAPPTIPHGIGAGDAPAVTVGGLRGLGDGLPAAFEEVGSRAVVAVAPEKVRGPMRVSSGVAAGMLMSPIRPVYPSIARAARVEGSVVVAAVISREGRIEQAHVVSGPAMLAGAALDAMKTARYLPYRLNGAATEVETTITVNFRMGG